MKDIFDSYWHYAVGFAREPRTRFVLWAALYVVYAFLPVALALALSAWWGWLLMYALWFPALAKMAEPMLNARHEWKTGKTYDEERRESWMQLGAVQQRINDTLTRIERQATYLDN